ncbi:DUF2029 domain-containing protein [Thioclava sp. BHET1]|nr:DUF2029 domain-containing protein [Thioclava sp. BHET1]
MQDKRGAGADPARLIAAMVVLVIALAALPLLKGALIIDKHEGDTLHLSDIVLRMADYGQWPQLDFMTPLGLLAVWPIALFVKAGWGVGMAFVAAQTAVAVILLGPILRAALSRFPGWTAWAYAAFCVVLILALVPGEANAALSVSMHYNRWAWAVAYVALPLAILEPLGRRRPWTDGALIGLAFAALVLIKITYAAALFPAVLLALILRRDFKAIAAAVLWGGGVMALVTVMMGVAYWPAYLHDLLTVAGSTTRAAPGMALPGVIAAPAYLGGTIALLASVIFLRQAGRMREGLVLLVLAPGFVYVTYQNFGNDPQWLILAGLLAISLRPEGAVRNALGWPLRQALLVVGVAMLAFGLPTVVNLAWSPMRLYAADAKGKVPFLTHQAQGRDLLISPLRMYRVMMSEDANGPGEPYADFADRYKQPKEEAAEGEPKDDALLEINGIPLPACSLSTGYNAWFESAAQKLMQGGYGGSSIFVTDLFSALWLYGNFKPLEGGAPWYYSGTPGLKNADYVLVPLCPTFVSRRDEILRTIQKEGWTLDLVARSRIYLLFKPVPPKARASGG